MGINILWAHHYQKCSVFIVGVWRNVLCIVLIVFPEIPPQLKSQIIPPKLYSISLALLFGHSKVLDQEFSFRIAI